MLVGPFDEPWLLYSLRSVAWANEIVIVDNNMHEDNSKRLQLFTNEHNNIIVVDYYKIYDKFRFDWARNLAKEVSTSDYILKIDADEVYYDSFKNAFAKINPNIDCFRGSFYHFYYSDRQLHSIQSAEILFKNDQSYHWENAVHEHIVGPTKFAVIPFVVFAHYGYVKPQRAIYNKWKLYSELGDEGAWTEDLDPDHVIDGHKTIYFGGELPEVFKRI